MSEIRLQEVVLVGRILGEPQHVGEESFFRMKADDHQEAFPCFCDGRTAENMKRHLHSGDEISIEGQLVWKEFSNTSPMLVIYARFVSYGRKARTLQPDIGID